MKEYEVKITEYALSSMGQIADYITYDLKSPQSAISTLKTIKCEISKLSTMPNRIPLVDEEPWRGEGMHKMIVNNFFVYFWVDEDNFKVQVTNVVYARRDQKIALQNMPLN